jgi:hypothetical protein
MGASGEARVRDPLESRSIGLMRIALTGAHGVGKSTLADELAELLYVPVLPTPGRTLAARGLPVNEEATVTSQTLAWLLQYRFEREQRRWVAPRTLIDVWAYTVQAAARQQLTTVEGGLLEELRHATHSQSPNATTSSSTSRRASRWRPMGSGKQTRSFSARRMTQSWTLSPTGGSLTRSWT